MKLSQMKYIADMINSPFIDKQVYGLNKSIWLPNSYKYIQKQNKYENWYYPVNEHEYVNYIVNNIDGCIEF